jgi:very-short-patch-repair endonuclease
VGVDGVIARLAGRQDGIVTRGQLDAAGVSRDAIKHRLTSGRLIALYRGVYAVGHEAISDLGRIRAALYAAGPLAVASHLTAAFLHKLIPSLPLAVEVTLRAGNRRPRPDLRIHRSGDVETTRIDGIVVTTVRQTLEDLGWPERLVGEALARRLLRPEDVPADADAAPTHSELERRMRRLCSQAHLPEPTCQYPIGPYRIDFAWPTHRLLVETDGYSTHGHRQAFEADRARDAYLIAHGYTVLRFTWRQIERTPMIVAARLAAALALNTSTPAAP